MKVPTHHYPIGYAFEEYIDGGYRKLALVYKMTHDPDGYTLSSQVVSVFDWPTPLIVQPGDEPFNNISYGASQFLHAVEEALNKLHGHK